MDQVIREILRAHLPIQPRVFERWRRHLRDVTQPQLDRLAELERTSEAPAPAKRARERVSA